MNTELLPDCWQTALAPVLETAEFDRLCQFLEAERRDHTIYPDEPSVFAALQQTPLKSVRVLILGQDPYHGEGQAHGLSFSVPDGITVPPSLRNIFRELHDDLGEPVPQTGCLKPWARQGVLLLNTVLTVRAGEPQSHRSKGWEAVTDHIISCVNHLPAVAFVLWGRSAQAKQSLINDRHLVISSAHPSPLSARRGFFGSRPFSRINAYLRQQDLAPVDWSLSFADG